MLLVEKQVDVIPPLNVEVAVVDVALKYGAAIFVPASIPAEKVVVAVLLKL